ncbi:MAG: hypothetical protein AAGN82_19900 [Myxococcota bacterium]
MTAASPSEEFAFGVSVAPVTTVDELVVLSLRLGYLGTGNVYVPIRFAVAPLGDVRLRVLEARPGEDPTRELPFGKRVRLAPVRASDFIAVEPGEVIAAGYPLSEGYRLERARTYTIHAEFVCPEPPEELRGYRVATGRFAAPETRLTVR